MGCRKGFQVTCCEDSEVFCHHLNSDSNAILATSISNLHSSVLQWLYGRLREFTLED